MSLATESRVPLSRDRVLRVAIRLADEGGIESLSMRKLGQALGVEAMSLYNHVANKDDLLNGIADLVWNEIDQPSAGEAWEAAIRKSAISAHDLLVQHRWAANLIMSTSRVRPARLRYMEALMCRLRQAGFSAQDTYHAYHALDSHILGFTLWQLGHTMPTEGPSIRTREDMLLFVAKLLPGLALDEFPYLIEHAEMHLGEGPHKEENEFEFGLRLILDGLKRMKDNS